MHFQTKLRLFKWFSIWTEDGVYSAVTGKKVQCKDNTVVHALKILEDNKRVKVRKENDNWIHHPSFGMIRIDHSNGRSRLFGSMLEDNSFITLTIDHGLFKHGELKEEYFTESSPIVKIRMSKEQLGEMFFSTNYNLGVPCTISYTEMDGYISEPPYENLLEKTENDFAKELSDNTGRLRGDISYIKEMIDEKKTFSKSDMREIVSRLESTERGLSDHLSYYMNKFNEYTTSIKSAVYSESKARVESMLGLVTKRVLGTEEGHTMLTNMKNNVEIPAIGGYVPDAADESSDK